MHNWQELLETAEFVLDQHVNQFRHTCQAKREHRPRAQALVDFIFQTVMSSSQLQKMNGRRGGSRERMELVQTDIRANSHDSESKITDEVEANVGLRRKARWPKERLSAAFSFHKSRFAASR